MLFDSLAKTLNIKGRGKIVLLREIRKLVRKVAIVISKKLKSARKIEYEKEIVNETVELGIAVTPYTV